MLGHPGVRLRRPASSLVAPLRPGAVGSIVVSRAQRNVGRGRISIMRELAGGASRVERFFVNLVLVRVMYAHALVSRAAARARLAGPASAACWATPGSG